LMSSDEWDCRKALTMVANDAAIGGSKLVFDCQHHNRDDAAAICRRIPSDLPLIHLTRNYFDIILSLKTRGAFNLMNRPPAKEGDDSILARALQQFEADPRVRELETGRAVDLSPAAFEEALLYLVQNDLFCLALCQQAERSFRLDYAELHDRLPEIARFVGYKGPLEPIEAIRRNPVTRKLTKLSDDLVPNAAEYRRICEIVYAKMIFICEMNIPFDQVWKKDGTIELPGLNPLSIQTS